MDLYHIWCNLREGISDVVFCDRVEAFLGSLRDEGRIASFRITRKKLGLAPSSLGEFHIVIEVKDLQQLDRAFHHVSTRAEPVESLHAGVNQWARDVTFALYRDFPDPQRQRGQEQF